MRLFVCHALTYVFVLRVSRCHLLSAINTSAETLQMSTRSLLALLAAAFLRQKFGWRPGEGWHCAKFPYSPLFNGSCMACCPTAVNGVGPLTFRSSFSGFSHEVCLTIMATRHGLTK